ARVGCVAGRFVALAGTTLAPRLYTAVRHRRLWYEHGRSSTRMFLDQRARAVRADLLVARHQVAHGATRPLATLVKKRQRLDQQRSAALHVEDTRTDRASVLLAQRIATERADRMHGVDVRQQQHRR